MLNKSNDNSCLGGFIFQWLTYFLSVESLKPDGEDTHYQDGIVQKLTEQLYLYWITNDGISASEYVCIPPTCGHYHHQQIFIDYSLYTQPHFKSQKYGLIINLPQVMMHVCCRLGKLLRIWEEVGIIPPLSPKLYPPLVLGHATFNTKYLGLIPLFLTVVRQI